MKKQSVKLSYQQRLQQIQGWKNAVQVGQNVQLFKEWIAKAESTLYEYYEADQQLRKSIVEKRLSKSLNLDGKTLEIWYAWAQTQYKTYQDKDSQYIVESLCKDWNEQNIWVVDSPSGQLEKIEILIGYKIYDRSRESGNILKDIEKYDQAI